MAKPTHAKRSKIISEILKAVKAGRTFFLSGHQKPDGDTVGSELAFASFLKRLGKKVDIYNYESIPEHLMFLPGAKNAKVSRKVDKIYDVAVIFECSGADRMGNIIDLDTQAETVINIDHHAHHSYFGDINLINPKASSNSEQLYFVFKQAKMPITKEEAMALYVGLVTDTGRFQQENANPESHIVAAGLHEAGIDVADICRRLYATKSPESLKLLSRALASLKMEEGGRVSVLTVTHDDFSATGTSSEDLEDVINFGLMVPSADVAILARDTEEGQVKLSLRGKGRVDLMKIAVSYGGGGHKNASGCTVPGPLPQAVDSVLSRIRPVLPS